jgi:hypothetical protein
MPSKQDVISQLNAVTDKLSDRARTTALGVLALTWGLFIGDSAAARAITVHLKVGLLLLGAGAMLVLFLDFLQYFFGYFSTRRVLEQIESENTNEGSYDYDSWFWRLRLFFFWAKQAVLIFTVVLLLVLLGRWAIDGT